jgi:enoyl-CoA hydratase/carnithine racemase
MALPDNLTRLILERRGDAAAVLWVSLSNPAMRNAMDDAMQRELIATIRAAGTDESIRCVVVRGEGGVFSSGGDISAFQGMGPEKCHWYATERGDALQKAVVALGKPLICAVDGWCLAGGTELLLMSDFAYCSRAAKFGVTEIRIGLLPLWGGTTRLPMVVGLRRAREMLYRGEIVDSAEALRLGLVNRCFDSADELYAAAGQAADEIAARPRFAIRAARELTALASGRDDAACLALERGASVHLAATADAKEGIAAFLEKRPPRFNQTA